MCVCMYYEYCTYFSAPSKVKVKLVSPSRSVTCVTRIQHFSTSTWWFELSVIDYVVEYSSTVNLIFRQSN